MLLRLDPPLPLLVRVKNEWVKGMGHLVIDYGYDHDLCWIIFLDGNRECWTVTNANIRIQDNITAGRMPIAPPDNARPVLQERADG